MPRPDLPRRTSGLTCLLPGSAATFLAAVKAVQFELPSTKLEKVFDLIIFIIFPGDCSASVLDDLLREKTLI